MNDFVPTTAPERMAQEPEVSRKILRQVLGWLAENAADLPDDEQREIGRQAGIRSGLYAAEFPEADGGWSLPARIAVDLREEAAATGRQYGFRILSAHDGPSWILQDATPGQRERWLRPLIEGRWTRCLAMTEEQGGSDLRELRTTATRDGAGWVLTGRKFLITNAAHADLAIVLANAVAPGASGPTFFVFTTDTPGWKVVRRLPGMDHRYDQYEVELDAVRVGDEAVLGGAAQIGGATGMAGERLTHGRVCLAARAVGLGGWALGVARRHAARRTVGGVRLADKQYIREFLVRSDVKLTAARALVRQAAADLDRHRLAMREAAMAKLWATESACEVIDDAMQVLGGRGWLSEYGLEQAYREARLFRIVDGTSEVLKETIFHLPGGEGGS
ncbi:acyl-CoA dehydrogenase family protein [Actinomadura macra]|uniref:acyl-CoA dehydrogenase family protein n=1 Tax=Actinomadura macra TaxID=46164 RepID=UPI00082D32BD|nr:acyl-CoA dehydrogenase family protein [Actinomadura macra]